MHSLSRYCCVGVAFLLCGCVTQQDRLASVEPNIIVDQVIEDDPITRMSFVADERTGEERVAVVFYNNDAQLNSLQPASGTDNGESLMSESDH